MSELLSKYNWEAGEYTPLTGTDDWALVAELGQGGYSWAEFNAFYSPAARRFFWHGDTGCSCNGWSDDLTDADSFQSGDLAALLRAWKTFAEENDYDITITDYLSGADKLRNFEVIA